MPHPTTLRLTLLTPQKFSAARIWSTTLRKAPGPTPLPSPLFSITHLTLITKPLTLTSGLNLNQTLI